MEKIKILVLVSLVTLTQGIISLGVTFRSGPSIRIKDGLAYVGGCEYISNQDLTKAAFLLIDNKQKIQLIGVSKKLQKIPNPTTVVPITLPTTVDPTIVTNSSSSTEGTTTKQTTTIVTTTTTKTKAPVITFPITIPKITIPPLRITIPPITIPKNPFGGFGRKRRGITEDLLKKAKEKLEKEAKALLKNIYLFELPEVLLTTGGIYRCGILTDPKKDPVLSSKSKLISLPGPLIFKGLSISQAPRKVGQSLAIKGCIIKSNSNIAPDKGYLFWLKDGQRSKEKGSFTVKDGTYTMQDLIIKTTSIADQGFYQCGIKTPSMEKEKLSGKVHVQFIDTATTKYVLKLNEQWSDIYLDQSSVEYKTLSNKVKDEMNQALIIKNQEVNVIGFSQGSINAVTKVTLGNLKANERLQFCKASLQSRIDETSLQNNLQVVNVNMQPLDCCAATSKGKETYKGVYQLPQSVSLSTFQSPCKYNIEANMTILCLGNQDTGATWATINLNACKAKFNSTNRLLDLKKVVPCNKNRKDKCETIINISKALRDIVKEDGINTEEDLNCIVKIMSKILTQLDPTDVSTIPEIREIVEILFEVLEVYLGVPVALIGQSQAESMTSSLLLHTLDNFAKEYQKLARYVDILPIPIQVNLDLKLKGKNIAFSIQRNKKKQDLLVKAVQKNGNVEIDITKNTEENVTTDTLSMIRVPSEAFDNNDDFIYSYYFRIPSLFLSEDMLLTILGRLAGPRFAVQSNVLSTTIGTKKTRNLTRPVILTFQRSLAKNLTGNNVCHFWDMKIETSFKNVKGGWSEKGCKPSEKQLNNDFFCCECDHLTNFALLLDIAQTGENPLELQIVTWIGCALSMIGLVLTIVSYVIFKNVRKTLPPKLLICLSTSLLILLIIFLVGIERTSNRLGCQFIAALIHYFILTTFCWMFVEAISFYRLFVLVFKSGSDKTFLVRANLFAWGVPAIIVAFTVGFEHEEYGTDRLCSLHGVPFFATVVGPVALVLVCNFIVLCMVMRTLTASKRKANPLQENSNLVDARIAFACNVLLGITWVFALLAVGYATRVLQWLFCIFNSLQGFFIFIFYTLRNKDLVKEWKKCFGEHDKHSTTGHAYDMHNSAGKHSSTSTSVTNTSSSNNNTEAKLTYFKKRSTKFWYRK